MLKAKVCQRLSLIAALAWLLISAGGVTSNVAGEVEQSSSQPNIQLEERIYDFGRVDEGSKVTHIYKFKNVGQGNLYIEKIRTSCGCTATFLSAKDIPPNREGEIKAVFDTRGRKGRQAKLIMIYSNDPDEPVLRLKLTGFVGPPLILKPDSLLFLEVERGETITRKLVASPVGKELLKITGIESTSAYLTAEIAKNPPEQKNQIEITVTLSPEVPLGNFNEKLKFYLEGEENLSIEVPVSIMVKSEIKVIPQRLFFGHIPKGQSPSRQVIVRQVYNPDNKDLKILRIESSRKYLSALISSSEDGKQYSITVTLTPEAPPGRIKGTINIYTNNPRYTVIKVPVSALVSN